MTPLTNLPPGQEAKVTQITSQDAGRLARLSAFGLVPGSRITLQQCNPAYVVRVGETEVALDRDVVSEIIVRLE